MTVSLMFSGPSWPALNKPFWLDAGSTFLSVFRLMPPAITYSADFFQIMAATFSYISPFNAYHSFSGMAVRLLHLCNEHVQYVVRAV